MESFEEPFKAIPQHLKRLTVREDPDKPSSPSGTKAPTAWGLAALGVLIGVCVGLAYVFSAV
ncbi:MAG: hypothetical protein O9293_09820 [Porphyrobacter sp.]|nr:hypothetical protein [Porphyrobacter sp.]